MVFGQIKDSGSCFEAMRRVDWCAGALERKAVTSTTEPDESEMILKHTLRRDVWRCLC